MSYGLDGVFSTRNQGQLVSTVQTQTKMIRTPGLAAVNEPLANFGHAMGAETTPPAEMITLPLIGAVKKQTAILGVGALALAFLWWRQR
jgi:hypothetical protein